MRDGQIIRSNCLGQYSIEYLVEGVVIRAAVPAMPESRIERFGLYVSLRIGEGKRVAFLDDRVIVTSLADSASSAAQISFVRMQDGYNELSYRESDEVLEVMFGADRLVGKRVMPRTYSFTVFLKPLYEKDFRIELPALLVDEKRVAIPPISFTQARRVETLVPINC